MTKETVGRMVIANDGYNNNLGDCYSMAWTERQAAEDICERFIKAYGEKPKNIIVQTRTIFIP